MRSVLPCRRRGGAIAAFALVAVLGVTTACVSAQQRTPASPRETTPRSGDPGAPASDRTIHHVLNRLGFGARPGDVERVRRVGLAVYIDQQLNPERLPDSDLDARLAEFTTLSMTSRDLMEKFFAPARDAQQALQRQRAADPQMASPAGAPVPPTPTPELMAARQNEARVLNELTQARLLRAVMSERQLDEVLVDFWFNHFNVFVGKGQVRQYLPEYERDVIRPYVLGRFRDLLGAVAHSPAMLFYLDNWQSSAPNAGPGRGARPGPARGLNENYGRELMELHTLGVDAGYTQKDVVDVARALTGWTIDRPQQGGGFIFRLMMHDRGEKVILGNRFPAGHGEDEGERVLDILSKHPSTARHIAFKLAQRFIADEPPAAVVDRAAKVFRESDGDLRRVVQTIVTSPEFFAPAAYRAKVKTPLEFVISALRASGATVANAQPIAQALRTTLGMPLYGCQPPTGYSNTADAWVNTGALLSRMNIAVQLVNSQARWLRVDLATLAPNTSEPARDALVDTVLGGDASDGTRHVLARAETPPHLMALVLGSPEFQRK